MNMKKFFMVLVFGLAVFAISCSTEDSFLNKVKGKTVSAKDSGGDTYTIVFNADGKSATVDGETVNFVSATDENNATYSGVVDLSSFGLSTSESVTATVVISGSSITVTVSSKAGSFVYTGTL